jgi:hypothetical protein
MAACRPNPISSPTAFTRQRLRFWSCRPEQATGNTVGSSVARRGLNGHRDVPSHPIRLRSSGSTLRDLVPAYMNHPG